MDSRGHSWEKLEEKTADLPFIKAERARVIIGAVKVKKREKKKINDSV